VAPAAGEEWPVGGGSTPPTGPIREGSLAVLTIGRQDDSAGDPTPRMLGECACAVNWDAPGGGTAHATGRPRGEPRPVRPRRTRVEPGPRRNSSIRASAPLVKGFLTWKARRLLPWHSAGLDSWTGCPMRARTVLVSTSQSTPIDWKLRLRLSEWLQPVSTALRPARRAWTRAAASARPGSCRGASSRTVARAAWRPPRTPGGRCGRRRPWP